MTGEDVIAAVRGWLRDNSPGLRGDGPRDDNHDFKVGAMGGPAQWVCIGHRVLVSGTPEEVVRVLSRQELGPKEDRDEQLPDLLVTMVSNVVTVVPWCHPQRVK